MRVFPITPTLTSPSGLFSAMLPHTTTQPFFCGPAASPFLPPSFPPHDLKMSRARYAAIVPDHLHDDLMLLYSHVYTSCSRSFQISHSWMWFRCCACGCASLLLEHCVEKAGSPPLGLNRTWRRFVIGVGHAAACPGVSCSLHASCCRSAPRGWPSSWWSPQKRGSTTTPNPMT